MGYKRKNNTYKASDNQDNTTTKAKGHAKNIGILLLCLIGIVFVKGMMMASSNEVVKTIVDAPMITDMQWGVTGSSYSVDRTPSPELFAEVTELRKEISVLQKGEFSQISRGDVSREIKKPSYDFSKLFGNPAILKTIEDQCAKHAKGDTNKEFFEVIYSLVMYESHFDPAVTTITPTEHSIGLLQVNTYTNAPKNVNVEQFRKNLKDPRFNLDYQLDELYDFYVLGKGKGLKGKDLACFVSKYGQRPNWKSKATREYIMNSIYNTYIQLAKAKNN